MGCMEALNKLFGSAPRVRLMRLFLMNPEDIFDRTDIEKRSRVSGDALRKEVALLKDVGFIKERSMVKMFPKKNGMGGELEKKKVKGFALNPSFPFLGALRALVTEIVVGRDDLAARFKNCGSMKLIIAAGVFIDERDSRVDILLVGDKLKKPAIESALRRLEAELGKELTYGVMETPEFEYRYGIYDKFIRDIIDYPHLVVLNKLNLF